MDKKNLLPMSIFALAISIVIGSLIISRSISWSGENIRGGLSQGAHYINEAINNSVSSNYYEEERSNINFEEAAAYLGISQAELMLLVNKEEYDIPCVKINGAYIFNKEGLDKWVQESKAKL